MAVNGKADRHRFHAQVGTGDFIGHMHRLAGPEAVADWKKLQVAMEPYTKAAAAVPSMALRQDPAAAINLLGRYLPSLLSAGPAAARLVKPASEVNSALTRTPCPFQDPDRLQDTHINPCDLSSSQAWKTVVCWIDLMNF